ncbi:unnamed protein product [[Candida] boidinii]|nr:unnamed protein product [[Candida] boidinii]
MLYPACHLDYVVTASRFSLFLVFESKTEAVKLNSAEFFHNLSNSTGRTHIFYSVSTLVSKLVNHIMHNIYGINLHVTSSNRPNKSRAGTNCDADLSSEL